MYAVEFKVYPEIGLKDLENFKVKKLILMIKNKDIDRILKTLRKQ
ncbi:MAG: trigger factor [Arsenophonus sp. NC-PG7-MAG3]